RSDFGVNLFGLPVEVADRIEEVKSRIDHAGAATHDPVAPPPHGRAERRWLSRRTQLGVVGEESPDLADHICFVDRPVNRPLARLFEHGQPGDVARARDTAAADNPEANLVCHKVVPPWDTYMVPTAWNPGP